MKVVDDDKKNTGIKMAVEMPLISLHRLAERLFDEIENNPGKREKLILEKLLMEVLKSHAHFLAGIFVSIYLQDDYKKVRLDASISNFLKNPYSSYNELIGLSETLCLFLKRTEGFEKKYGKEFFNISFNNIKLKAPPLSGAVGDNLSHLNIQYYRHIKKTIDKFLENTSIISNGKIEILLNSECKDDSIEFKNGARQILYNKKIIEIPGKKEANNETGACWLIFQSLNGPVKIQLDPVIIPLKNNIKGLRLASILYIGAYQTSERCLLEYRELSGDSTVFCTNDERLSKAIYFKKGNISESPEFAKEFNLYDGRFKLQLYLGDIFDLNFLENIKDTAFVNILYNDLEYNTPISKRLELLSGISIKESLKDTAKIQTGKIYTVKGSGSLNFKYIFHCPVYDVHQIYMKNPGKSAINVIKQSISHIISECLSRKVETLIAPAMGSFWAGQAREEVAAIWCEEIKKLMGMYDFRLKRIVFSFINEETFTVYKNSIYSNTDELYKNYQLPVASLHNDMESQIENIRRLERALDLSEYLYSFLVAWAIRSIMRGKIATHIIKNKKKLFIKKIKESFGYGCAGSFRGMTSGRWQQLCEMGYNAIKNDEWGFDNLFVSKRKFIKRRKNKSKLGIFHDFIKNTSNYDFPKWRNDFSHAPWHLKNDGNLKPSADQAVRAIKEVIKNIEFLNQDILKLIKVKKFEVNTDAGTGCLQYYDLRGNGFNYIHQQTIKRDIEDFNGTIFEENKVYLIKEEKIVKSLLLHPFILYGNCPGCHRKTIFVWRDNLISRDKKKKGIKYGSISCDCKQINTEPIAGFSHSELFERFENILCRLDSEKKVDG